MRKDFHKVLTEDPRRLSRSTFHPIRNAKENAVFDDEFSGGKESMMKRRRVARGERKSFGDHLSPLRRFMAKNVGRPWNDVYSEICQTFDQRKFTNKHIMQHVERDCIENNVCLIDGKIHAFSRWDGWEPIKPTDNQKWATYYAHPVTGVLCSNFEPNATGSAKRKAEERDAERHARFRVHDRDTHLYLIDGVWFVYKLADIPAPRREYHRPIGISPIEWSTLSRTERERRGHPVWVRGYTPLDNPADTWPWRLLDRKTCPPGRYYSEKLTASRKILRKHGLHGG
jgi:hypothetical protein